MALTALVAVAILFFFQDRLLWHPRPYGPGEVASFPRSIVTIPFHTPEGDQVVFYAGPGDGRSIPAALWVLVAGNGSLALDWAPVVANDADMGRAFLMVDYPRYGQCEGTPSPTSIAQSVDGAMRELASRLGEPTSTELCRTLQAHGTLGVMGHSMGTGVALDFAVRTPEVSRIVLVSPFTSLRAMARRAVGWPLCQLLRGNFDNSERLDALSRRAALASVLILHGDKDTLIPPAMGRALAAAHPDFVHFESVPGAGHDDIVALSKARLVAALDGR